MPDTKIAQEEIAPFLDPEKVELEAEAATKGPEVQVSSEGAGRKVVTLLSHRSTYYWIALIAQFCHMVVTAIAYGVSIPYDRNAPKSMKYVYLASELYSLSPFFLILSLIKVQHKKLESGPKRILAGKHYIVARLCVIFDLINFIYLLLTFAYPKDTLIFDDPVRAVATPLAVGFVFVAALACMKAARITRLAAQQARGTEMVPDPEYRVPAWHLATMDESQVFRRANRDVQLPA